LFKVGDDNAWGTYKKKEGFIRFKGLWGLISVHRLIEHYVMCVIFNFTEEGHIRLIERYVSALFLILLRKDTFNSLLGSNFTRHIMCPSSVKLKITHIT
jgi:hypothetical protein